MTLLVDMYLMRIGKRKVPLKKQVSSKARYASTNDDNLHHKQSRKIRLALGPGK
jgi:hypothetical protein